MLEQVYAVDTITGDVIDRVAVSGFDWSRLLCAGGDGAVTIPLDGTYTKADLRTLTKHWAVTFVLEQDGAVRAAGIVNGRPYARGGQLQVKLVDLWGIWARRLAVDKTAPKAELWSVTYTGTSLRTLAKRAVQRGTVGSAAPPSALPVTLEADIAGTLARTYYGYHYQYVADVLSDLMNEGVDVDFVPRWVAGKLDWQMVTGVPIAGQMVEWDVTAPDTPVTGFGEDSDGARMTNNAPVIGEGSEVKMLTRSNRDLTSTLPLLEQVMHAKQGSDETALFAVANQTLAQYKDPTELWQFSVTADAAAGVQPGDVARLHFDGDPWIEDGYYNRRIVKLSGSMGASTVQVGVQATGGL